MYQDREVWVALETEIVARATRVPASRVQGLPLGRQVMPDARIPLEEAFSSNHEDARWNL